MDELALRVAAPRAWRSGSGKPGREDRSLEAELEVGADRLEPRRTALTATRAKRAEPGRPALAAAGDRSPAAWPSCRRSMESCSTIESEPSSEQPGREVEDSARRARDADAVGPLSTTSTRSIRCERWTTAPGTAAVSARRTSDMEPPVADPADAGPRDERPSRSDDHDVRSDRAGQRPSPARPSERRRPSRTRRAVGARGRRYGRAIDLPWREAEAAEVGTVLRRRGDRRARQRRRV